MAKRKTTMPCPTNQETPEPTQEKPVCNIGTLCEDCGEYAYHDDIAPTATPEEEKPYRCDKCFIGDLHKARQFKCEKPDECGCPCAKNNPPEQKDFVEGKWEEKRKELYTGYVSQGLPLQSALDQAYAQGEQDMLSRAKEAMPKKKAYRTMYSQESEGFQREDFSAGFNRCRTEALSALEALTTKT